MKNLFQFVKVYHFVLLFIFIESFSLFLYFSNHKFQASKLLSFTNEYTGYIYEYYNNLSEYLNLKDENKKLKEENANLYSILISEDNISPKNITNNKIISYNYIGGRIIKNSISNNNNFIVINKGEKDGVNKGMGVVVENGIIGIIESTSKNYSKAISILNQRSSVSVIHNNSNHNGSLNWKTKDYMIAKIENIPNHANIKIGDTIQTNGYSNVYPAGIPIGTISSFKKIEEDGFYNIDMRFINDMNSTTNVYIIKSLNKKEKESLIR